MIAAAINDMVYLSPCRGTNAASIHFYPDCGYLMRSTHRAVVRKESDIVNDPVLRELNVCQHCAMRLDQDSRAGIVPGSSIVLQNG